MPLRWRNAKRVWSARSPNAIDLTFTGVSINMGRQLSALRPSQALLWGQAAASRLENFENDLACPHCWSSVSLYPDCQLNQSVGGRSGVRVSDRVP